MYKIFGYDKPSLYFRDKINIFISTKPFLPHFTSLFEICRSVIENVLSLHNDI